MTAAQAAQKVRNAIRKTGTDPKGLVRVINTGYTTEVDVDMKWLDEDAEYKVFQVINEIDGAGGFAWNCY